jgi:acetyl esterase/lipase
MPSIQSHFLRFVLKHWVAPGFDHNSPLAQKRALLEEMGRQVRILPNTAVRTVCADGVPAEWITAAGAADDRVILYLHGGAYNMGSCNTHRELVTRLSIASGASVLLLDYRLAPEHPFPAAVEDSVAAYQWLLRTGIMPYNIVIAGDSAGGGLTISTLLYLRDHGLPLPSAGICLSPWADLDFTGESIHTKAKADPWLSANWLKPMAAHYIGQHGPCHPLISPVYADLHHLPPLLIHVGEDEILLSDAVRLASQARNAGVLVSLDIWQKMWHVWHSFAQHLPEGRRAIDEIGRFIQEHVGQPAELVFA